MTAPRLQYRGATLTIAATYLGPDALPASVAGKVITAWVQTRDAQIAMVVVVTNVALGQFTLNMDEAVTATVPLGIWPVFVQYAGAGDVEKDKVIRVRFKDTAA
jgi:hypothetical protein